MRPVLVSASDRSLGGIHRAPSRTVSSFSDGPAHFIHANECAAGK